MDYNGSLEDPQNWPFSVRYTASPYRKSKFPVDTTTPNTFVPGETTTQNVGTVLGIQQTNHHQNYQFQHQQYPYPTEVPPYYTNGNTSNNSRNFPYHHQYHPQYHLDLGVGEVNNGVPGSTNNNGIPLGLNNYNQHLFYQPSYQQYCFLQQNQYPQQHYHTPATIHQYPSNSNPNHHYGLPLQHVHNPKTSSYPNTPNGQYFTRNHQPRSRSKCPPDHLQQFVKQRQIVNNGGGDGVVVDEGYIEDLKQSSTNHSFGKNLGNTNGINGPISVEDTIPTNQNTEYNPYSYAYDSKTHGENPVGGLGFSGTSILDRLQREALGQSGDKSWTNSQSFGANMPVNLVPLGHTSSSTTGEAGYTTDHTIFSGQYNNYNTSENEYEEIRDVARYMTMTPAAVTSPNEKKNDRKPLHFKSFSSTDDILAEVVQVKQGHDRVLDQLNLEVENLLIRSTNEIENHNYSNISLRNEHETLPVELFERLQYLKRQPITHHQQSLSMDSDVKPIIGLPPSSNTTTTKTKTTTSSGHGHHLKMTGSLKELKGTSSSQNSSCSCQGQKNMILLNRTNHNKSKSDTCADCCIISENIDSIGSFGIPTFGRKKKLDRATPFCQISSGSDLKTKVKGSTNSHQMFIASLQLDKPDVKKNLETKPPKVRHHRSYSLIPHWKIREHLMRLPFLRQYSGNSNGSGDKLKKTETSSLSSCESGSAVIDVNSISASAHRPLTTSVSNYILKKKKGSLKDQGPRLHSANNAPKNMTMTAVKTRSSSMDELRVTGQEEHWYSADSDTEPDSFTALPSEMSKVETALMTMNSSGLLTLGLNNGTLSPPPGLPTSNSENGSRIDVSNAITQDHIPKAPKFRRGSGIKDKWRESWTQSKTLSKSNMEEENRLLRWFSLRKNHGGSTTTVDGGTGSTTNRNSTLPLLSEEDLKRLSFMEDEEGYWPRRTVLPPTLPISPPDLTSEQTTRRHIVAAIVHSENNYVSALQRLVNEYKKPLECSHPVMLSHSKISTVFHRVPEILQCHSLFRIALAEYIRKWDADEKIGDVFVASFSKSLVLDVYSEFINNFGQAMETAKSETRRKSAFAEFLKVKQMTAHDRLSLFGLMVKPVQRFPQFILLLQDLLKHTPKDHHDRMSLQLALTQLESLAAMLNERKRESEQYQAFRETIKSIGGGKFVLLRSITDDPNRILVRQDIVTQLEFDNSGGTVAKSKNRKLLLLNDMLICVTMSQSGNSTSSSERSGRRSSQPTKPSDVNSNATNGNNNQSQTVTGKVEKSVFKWSYPVREVEVEDISISPTMSRFVSTTNVAGSNRQNKGSENPPTLVDEETQQSMCLLEEMQSLMYDYSILSRISELVTTLKSTYEGLTEAFIKELMLEIQHQIRCRDEQISYFDSSCLTLLLGTGNNREKVVFQMQSPAARNEWIEELRLAQLALDPNNSPGWDIPPESPYPHHRLPLFVRSLPLCRSPHLNTVKAGCFFTHTFVSPTGRSKILDYLWVSCTDGFSSHITAYRSQQNTLKEVSSFDMVEEKINDLIFVSGHVWMATESRKVMVFDPSDTEKGNISQCLLSDSVLKLTLVGNIIYAGLADGYLAVFTQIQNPKILEPDKLIKLGSDRIISVFGARDHIYASCGSSVVTIDGKTHTIERNVVLTHHNGPITHMACSGVGLWITTQDSGTVCLYHLESLQHLQDVSIAPSVFRTVRDSYRRQKGCHVTCLIAHKGWLWIGTNLGVVLTIPLPRLEGVPIINTGKANVSFHGYYGPITFLMPLTKPLPPTAASQPVPNSTRSTAATITTETIDKSTNEKNASILKTPKNNRSTTIPPNNTTEDDEKFRTPPRNNFSTVSFDEKDTTLTISNLPSSTGSPSLSNSSSFNDSKPGSGTDSPLQSIANGLASRSTGHELLPSLSGLNKTLVVLRKKNSRDSSVTSRNCKTLPRVGPIPLNLRFSIDSDVYGLYGNLINVRGLEDEGRFVDPLYDALLRRSDPELVALDAKINTLDRRLKMRMSRPRSLDLSNWSVDSKISASSDESVGLGGSRSSQATDSNIPTPIGGITTTLNGIPIPLPPLDATPITSTNSSSSTPSSGTNRKTISRTKTRIKATTERTVVVVVGGRGYVNMKSQNYQDQFINGSESESKQCTNLTVWQMKT